MRYQEYLDNIDKYRNELEVKNLSDINIQSGHNLIYVYDS